MADLWDALNRCLMIKECAYQPIFRDCIEFIMLKLTVVCYFLPVEVITVINVYVAEIKNKIVRF